MEIPPDLSHLTDAEKDTIQAVIRRQRVDEDEASSYTDYSCPSMAILSRQHSQTNESGSVCQICQRTKFVNEHSSRQCSLCHRRVCVRCGIRLKSQYYICKSCQQKQEQYFSSSSAPATTAKNIRKQYLSDYILSQTCDEEREDRRRMYGANEKRTLPQLQANPLEEEISSPESTRYPGKTSRLLPEVKQNLLRQFQYHSLEERDVGQEATLKDSGIDTASSSTILNVISAEKLKQPMTSWRWNDARTEQIGDVYLKTHFPASNFHPTDILHLLGLHVHFQKQSFPEIIQVTPGSITDTYGQLRPGDHILEWNGEKCVNLHCISLQSPQIHLLVKRSIHFSRISQEEQIQPPTIENLPIQLNLSFQYDQTNLHIMIYGARNIPHQQGLFACQLVLQNERDISSIQEKCTKAQSSLAGQCTWNQHIIFFDIPTVDNLILWIKLINLEHNLEGEGDIRFDHFNFNTQPEWYNLTHSSFNHVLPDIPSTGPNRRRQLPDIPSDKLQANREKVSQDLFQKATELKLRLMQTRNERSRLNQRSFDQSQLNDYEQSRTSMNTLTSSTLNLKEKPRIPVIKERRTVGPDPNKTDLEKGKFDSLERRRSQKSFSKQQSLATSVDDADFDGSEVSSVSRKSVSADRSRTRRKQSMYIRRDEPQYDQSNAIQLNEEELRQMEMRPYETVRSPAAPAPAPTPAPVPAASHPEPTEIKPSTEKPAKIDQRADGTVSDSGLSSQTDAGRKRFTSKQSKAFVILGLSKKANSSSTLGLNKRSGFQRSEEIGVQPHLRNRALERQTSKENETPTSAPASQSAQSPFHNSLQRDQYHSMPFDIKLWSGALKLPHEHQFTEFIDGLGKGQLVGRQVLASPCHGEIHLGLRDKNGLLEVEILETRNLSQKHFYRTTPALFVKIYLLDGKTCIEKQRTRTTRRVPDPSIHQSVIFKEDYRGRILQISVYGDYGKLDRKVFMGVCQVCVDEINLRAAGQLQDWYKLFSANSLMNNYMVVQQSARKHHDKP